MDSITQRFITAKQKLFERLYRNLNDEQRQAVFTVKGPLLILAGAGSGKTTVLTRRIEFIIRYGNAYFENGRAIPSESDVAALESALSCDSMSDSDIAALLENYAVDRCPDWAILAITFTNKAANEMKSRLDALLCPEEAVDADGDVNAVAEDADVDGDTAAKSAPRKSSEVRAGTFHSVCLRLLRRYCAEIGYLPGFTVYDTDDSKRAILACFKELGIDDKTLSPKTVQNEISRAKDQLMTPEDYDSNTDGNYTKERIAKIYELYQKHLRESNVLDFDDIIMKTVELLRNNDEVRESVCRRFKYVCVDEYQDTNKAQLELVRLLSSYHRNLMVVGDDDQSIYKFRGAQIENILSFEKHFDDACIIRLEQNYRSTANILSAANAVIANNAGRMGKTLRTDREQGEKLELKRLENQNEEAQFIINRIAELVMREKRRFSDFAVLYRVNAQSNSLENVFARSGIPYRVLGGMRFFERKEIKDILAYLCVVNNPNDSLRLKRIINEPKRKIGDTTVATVEAIAEANGMSMLEVMENADRFTALARVAPKLKEFTSIINTLRAISESESLPVTVEKTIELTGYRQMILMMGDSELDRLENLQEFISTAIDYENRLKESAMIREAEKAQKNDGSDAAEEHGDGIYDSLGEENLRPTLTGFLEDISLITDIDSYDSTADAVSLMTVHSAKGLEFPVVFLPGFEDGVFPSMQAIVSEDELEEERRLAYVALTRAKDRVYISHTRERLIYGRTMHNYVSRFVDEIPKEYLHSTVTQHRSTDADRRTESQSKPKAVLSSELTGKEKTAAHASSDTARMFTPGDTVEHVTFGRGEIITATPMGGDVLYEVIFDSVGTKKLMGKYARLKVAE